MDKYVKIPKGGILEKVAKKTLHGKSTPATSEEIVENILEE